MASKEGNNHSSGNPNQIFKDSTHQVQSSSQITNNTSINKSQRSDLDMFEGVGIESPFLNPLGHGSIALTRNENGSNEGVSGIYNNSGSKCKVSKANPISNQTTSDSSSIPKHSEENILSFSMPISELLANLLRNEKAKSQLQVGLSSVCTVLTNEIINGGNTGHIFGRFRALDDNPYLAVTFGNGSNTNSCWNLYESYAHKSWKRAVVNISKSLDNPIRPSTSSGNQLSSDVHQNLLSTSNLEPINTCGNEIAIIKKRRPQTIQKKRQKVIDIGGAKRTKIEIPIEVKYPLPKYLSKISKCMRLTKDERIFIELLTKSMKLTVQPPVPNKDWTSLSGVLTEMRQGRNFVDFETSCQAIDFVLKLVQVAQTLDYDDEAWEIIRGNDYNLKKVKMMELFGEEFGKTVGMALTINDRVNDVNTGFNWIRFDLCIRFIINGSAYAFGKEPPLSFGPKANDLWGYLVDDDKEIQNNPLEQIKANKFKLPAEIIDGHEGIEVDANWMAVKKWHKENPDFIYGYEEDLKFMLHKNRYRKKYDHDRPLYTIAYDRFMDPNAHRLIMSEEFQKGLRVKQGQIEDDEEEQSTSSVQAFQPKKRISRKAINKPKPTIEEVQKGPISEKGKDQEISQSSSTTQYNQRKKKTPRPAIKEPIITRSKGSMKGRNEPSQDQRSPVQEKQVDQQVTQSTLSLPIISQSTQPPKSLIRYTENKQWRISGRVGQTEASHDKMNLPTYQLKCVSENTEIKDRKCCDMLNMIKKLRMK